MLKIWYHSVKYQTLINPEVNVRQIIFNFEGMSGKIASVLLLCFCASQIKLQAGSYSAHQASGHINNRVAIADFGNYKVTDGSDTDEISNFLKMKLANLQLRDAGLILTHQSTSLAAYHYSFYQTYKNIPIYQAEISINVSKQNVVYAVFDNSYDVSGWSLNISDFDYTQVAVYQNYLRQTFGANSILRAEAHPAIVFAEEMPEPKYCYEVLASEGSGKQREVLVGRNEVIYERDAAMYHPAPLSCTDSTVHGLVYRPDPVTTADTLYGGNFMNNGGADNPVLTALEDSVTFTACFENDTFFLRNKYIQLTNLMQWVNPVTSLRPVFNFTRSDSAFEDVMTFYHQNRARQYLSSLGFNFTDTLVYVDAHGTPIDNSYFVRPNQIFIGMGGVPDAQDCDVTVHEYTHFLSWNANGSNHGTEERAGLDEGTCDYDAATYSRNINNYQWFWVYNWDGHNEFWPGRVVNDYRPYSVIQSFADRYVYGTCWASVLMQVQMATNKGVSDSLAFETLYNFGTSTTLPQAAQLYLKTDSLLFSGAHTCVIKQALAQRALAPDDPLCGAYVLNISNLNTDIPVQLVEYPDGFEIKSNNNEKKQTVYLYNIAGQNLAVYINSGTEIKPDVPPGIYIITLISGSIRQTFKWVHYN